MLILHDPDTLKHRTVELLGARLIPALECPERIEAILQAIKSYNHELLELDKNQHAGQVLDILGETHETGYVRHIRDAHTDWVTAGHINEDESILPECFPNFSMPHRLTETGKVVARQEPNDIFARSGYYAFDMSTGIMKDTYISALASARLALSAAAMLSNGSGQAAVCALCRPPGHHCDTMRAGGYCYFNNSVVAVTELLHHVRSDGSRPADLEVAILDIDMHHGNGTQSYFYDRKVRYASIHGKDEYPYYSGHADETGSAAGLGFNHNFLLAQKTPEADYLETLEKALQVCLQDSPRYLIICVGFDTFHLDPLGGFELDTQSYAKIGNMIAKRLAQDGIKAAILLEGGYVIESLGDNLMAFLSGWNS